MRDLATLLSADRAEMRTAGFHPLWSETSEPSSVEVHRVVGIIERHLPELFGRFGGLEEITMGVIDAFIATPLE